MSEKDKKKLKLLLEHWIEHNSDHGKEYMDWADKAKGFGEKQVHDSILEAVQSINKANESLLRALKLYSKQG
jgi:hypothetical protein